MTTLLAIITMFLLLRMECTQILNQAEELWQQQPQHGVPSSAGRWVIVWVIVMRVLHPSYSLLTAGQVMDGLQIMNLTEQLTISYQTSVSQANTQLKWKVKNLFHSQHEKSQPCAGQFNVLNLELYKQITI